MLLQLTRPTDSTLGATLDNSVDAPTRLQTGDDKRTTYNNAPTQSISPPRRKLQVLSPRTHYFIACSRFQ